MYRYETHLHTAPVSECGRASGRENLEHYKAMALHYADAYGLLHFAGTDNHRAGKQTKCGGMDCETPIENEQDFIRRVLDGTMRPFHIDTEQEDAL